MRPDWGWRIAFCFGDPGLAVGWHIRVKLDGGALCSAKSRANHLPNQSRHIHQRPKMGLMAIALFGATATREVSSGYGASSTRLIYMTAV